MMNLNTKHPAELKGWGIIITNEAIILMERDYSNTYSYPIEEYGEGFLMNTYCYKVNINIRDYTSESDGRTDKKDPKRTLIAGCPIFSLSIDTIGKGGRFNERIASFLNIEDSWRKFSKFSYRYYDRV